MHADWNIIWTIRHDYPRLCCAFLLPGHTLSTRIQVDWNTCRQEHMTAQVYTVYFFQQCPLYWPECRQIKYNWDKKTWLPRPALYISSSMANSVRKSADCLENESETRTMQNSMVRIWPFSSSHCGFLFICCSAVMSARMCDRKQGLVSENLINKWKE